MTDEIMITLNKERLGSLVKSNISCHANKIITQELIDDITRQIIDSIEFFINKKDDTL